MLHCVTSEALTLPFGAGLVNVPGFIRAFLMRTVAFCSWWERWDWTKPVKLQSVKPKQWAEFLNARAVELRWPAELGDSSLWLHHNKGLLSHYHLISTDLCSLKDLLYTHVLKQYLSWKKYDFLHIGIIGRLVGFTRTQQLYIIK